MKKKQRNKKDIKHKKNIKMANESYLGNYIKID